MGRFTAGLAAVLRSVLAHEELPPAPPPARSRTATPSWRLLGPEPLPPAPPSAGPTGAPPRGLVSLLLRPEPLPPDLPPAPRRRARWVAWLFAAEPLDP